MDKESIIELQKIDCNCNDCKFMIRDIVEYNKHLSFHQWQAKLYFDKQKQHAINIATACNDYKQQDAMLKKALSMVMQLPKSNAINYGMCSKLSKSVSFIPGTCQLHTQDCFEHRRQ